MAGTFPLFVGNLYKQSKKVSATSHKNLHDWCLFVSSKEDCIREVAEVSRVEYELHPSFRTAIHTVDDSPFLLSLTSWGVFPVKVRIHLHSELGGGVVQAIHSLSAYSSVTVTNVRSGETHYFGSHFTHDSIPKQWLSAKPVLISDPRRGVRTVTAQQLLLKRTRPSAVELTGFRLHFAEWFQIASAIRDSDGGVVPGQMPDELLAIVADFCLLNAPFHEAGARQTLRVADCHQCELHVSAHRLAALRVEHCTDFTIALRNVQSEIRVEDCQRLAVRCSGRGLFWKLTNSDEVTVHIVDGGSGTRVDLDYDSLSNSRMKVKTKTSGVTVVPLSTAPGKTGRTEWHGPVE